MYKHNIQNILNFWERTFEELILDVVIKILKPSIIV